MKNSFTVISLLALNLAQGQHFQHRFNLDYTNPFFRNERFNSGVKTKFNFLNGDPALFYYTGIGTSYSNLALPVPPNGSDRMRFTRLDHTGAVVLTNLGYQFYDASDGDAHYFHSSGNSIAEVDIATKTGGYVAVGAVTNNSLSGANNIAGSSDILFTRIGANGAILNTSRIDIINGNDITWCIRKSAVRDANNKPTWIMCGQSRHVNQQNNYTDCFVARVRADGTLVWCNRYNFDPGGFPFNTAHCIAKQLCEDAVGNIYVVGTLRDNQGGGNINGLAFKLGAAGAVVWAHDYDAGTDDEFQAIRLTMAGNLIVGGFTNFAAAGPVTSDMLIVQLGTAAGAIIFQNILRAGVNNTRYTSKCYDIIETAGPTYFLAGPAGNGANINQMMYKAGPAGMGINWYSYNPMLYNVGFGLDNDNGACPGVAYFSSMKNPDNPAFSDSHIMKTDFGGKTCDFDEQNPPFNKQVNLEVHNLNGLRAPAGERHLLASTIFNYDHKLICNDPCVGPATSTVQESASAIAAANANSGKVQLSPNPVSNILQIQFSALPAGEYQIILTDMEGRLAIQKNKVYNNGSSFTTLDMSSLASGIYLLIIRRGELMLQQKVVKQ